MTSGSRRVALAAGLLLAASVVAGVGWLVRASQREFQEGVAYAVGSSADACLEEIGRRSLQGTRSFLGLASTSFAEGCFGAALDAERRCLAIPPATSEEGYAWRAGLCGEVSPRTRGCHAELGFVQGYCDRVHPID